MIRPDIESVHAMWCSQLRVLPKEASDVSLYALHLEQRIREYRDAIYDKNGAGAFPRRDKIESTQSALFASIQEPTDEPR